MPVALKHMREALLPGLTEHFKYKYDWVEVSLGYAVTREAIVDNLYGPVAATVSAPVALAMGAAAAVIKNPVVSRRFLPWGRAQ